MTNVLSRFYQISSLKYAFRQNVHLCSGVYFEVNIKSIDHTFLSPFVITLKVEVIDYDYLIDIELILVVLVISPGCGLPTSLAVVVGRYVVVGFNLAYIPMLLSTRVELLLSSSLDNVLSSILTSWRITEMSTCSAFLVFCWAEVSSVDICTVWASLHRVFLRAVLGSEVRLSLRVTFSVWCILTISSHVFVARRTLAFSLCESCVICMALFSVIVHMSIHF